MVDFQGTQAARRAESQVGLIIVLSVIPTIISTTSVMLRIWTRHFILGGVASEDYAIIVAQLLGIGVAINNILMTTLGGLGRHIEFVMLTKGFFTAKVSLLSRDVEVNMLTQYTVTHGSYAILQCHSARDQDLVLAPISSTVPTS